MGSSSANIGLLVPVRRLIYKRRKYHLAKGAAQTLLVILGITAAACIISYFTVSAAVYAALKMILLLGAVCTAAAYMVIPALRDKNGADIVAELESLEPGLGGETLGALELYRSRLKGANRAGASGVLTDAFIGDVSGKLDSELIDRAYPLAELRHYFILLSVIAVLCAASILMAPGSFISYLLSAQITPAGKGDFIELADIEITLQYPEYTNLPDRILKGGTADVEALRGTKVLIKARPLGQLNKAVLKIDGGPSLPVTKAGSSVEGEFTVLEEGAYIMEDVETGKATRKFAVKLTPDRAPSVKISSPDGDFIEWDGKGGIDINYQAEDDYGLSALKLVTETETGGRSEKLIEKAGDGKSNIEGKTFWNPGSDNPGGGTIKLTVEAVDNDSVSGPKTGRSNAITVKLRDINEKHEEVLGLAERLLEEFIDTLAGEINLRVGDSTRIAGGGKSDRERRRDINLSAVRTEQDAITGQIDSSLDTLRKLIGSMAEDELSDYTYFAALSNMEVRIGGLLEERRDILNSLAVVDIPRLGRQMDREISEFEDDILFLDSMIKADRLRESLKDTRELMSEYNELSEMMKELGESGGEALNQEIMERLERIREMLAELAQKMSGLSAEIQEGFLNPDAFQASDMNGQLDEIMKLSQEGRMDEALAMLSEMTANLQNMMMSLQNGLQSFSSSAILPDLSKLNELIARIEGLEKEETGLKERTEDVKQSLIENPRSAEDNLRDFIKKQQKRIEEIKRNLAKAAAAAQAPGSPETEGAYLIDRTMQKADELGNWLEAADFMKALKSSQNLEDSAQALEDLGRAGIKSLTKSPREIENTKRLASEIRRDLRNLESSNARDPGFSEIASRQDEIRSDTEGLSGEIEELAEELPLSPEIGGKVEEAGRFMSKASKTLEDNEISRAISNQNEAVRALREAREQAQDMMQKFQASAGGGMIPVPMALGQRGMRHSPRGVDTRYVEIPESEDTGIGKEFKERILRAMKGGSPEGYGELNKEYYDRIIK